MATEVRLELMQAVQDGQSDLLLRIVARHVSCLLCSCATGVTRVQSSNGVNRNYVKVR